MYCICHIYWILYFQRFVSPNKTNCLNATHWVMNFFSFWLILDGDMSQFSFTVEFWFVCCGEQEGTRRTSENSECFKTSAMWLLLISASRADILIQGGQKLQLSVSFRWAKYLWGSYLRDSGLLGPQHSQFEVTVKA